MKTKNEFEQSLATELARTDLHGTVPWKNWKKGVQVEVTFAGKTFYGMKDECYIAVSSAPKGLQSGGVYGYVVGYEHRLPLEFASSGDSCAYNRVYPFGKTGMDLAMCAWYLMHQDFSKRGAIGYLTSNDGMLKHLRAIFHGAGFYNVCINKSKHGGYNVYLFVNPGSSTAQKIRTRKVELFNVEAPPTDIAA